MLISALVSYAKTNDSRRIIGKSPRIPWYSNKDFSLFKELTSDYPLVMGRNTFDSLGRVLPRHKNIVLSSDSDLEISDAFVTKSIREALDSASVENPNEVIFVGGWQVYSDIIKKIDRFYFIELPQLRCLGGELEFPYFQERMFSQIHEEATDDFILHIYDRRYKNEAHRRAITTQDDSYAGSFNFLEGSSD